MPRILLRIAYDGTEYSGFQRQIETPRTIAGTVARAVTAATGEKDIEVSGASRTDAGVHALSNYAWFDTVSRIPPEKFSYVLNSKLPEDIRVIESRKVADDFTTRHLHFVKTYEYHIHNAEFPDPLQRRYAWFMHTDLDIASMSDAAQHFVGEKDFRSFCNSKSQVLTTVRTLLSAEVICTAEKMPRDITIRVRGTGFLYNMVRIIVGTLAEVGSGRLMPEDIDTIIGKKDRSEAGPTAPPQGLVLADMKIVVDTPETPGL